MKISLAALLFVSIVWSGALAAPKGPQVDMIDNKLSVNADKIAVGQLLKLIDLATGMKSTVPADLAARPITVHFSGLSMTDGIRKMFQGQPLDYVMIQGQGIIVTSASAAGSGAGEGLPFNTQPIQQPLDQPFGQEFPGPIQQQFQQQQLQQQPMVQTPFGPLPNPRAQQPQPNAPLNMPGQQNSLFPQPGQGFNSNNPQVPVQIMPANQANPNPFGTASPFGTPNPQPANPNNGLFGSVPVFNPGAPPR